jgi:hypothetical protein
MELNLEDNRIGDQGARFLAKAFEKNTVSAIV